MRLPRLRFTVRRAMLAIALISVLMGLTREVGRLRRRSRESARQAVLSGRELRQWRRALIDRTAAGAEARRLAAASRARDPDLAEEWASEASACAREVGEAREFIAHFAGLHRKHRRAASWPWEAIAPDPPAPRQTLVWRCVALPKEPLPPGERWYAEQAVRRRVTALSR